MYEFTKMNGVYYMRIPKNQARKHYKAGYTVYGCTSKMKLDNVMCSYFSTEDYKGDFDKLVNEFEAKNCNYECGYYTHFYINYLEER